MHGSVLAFRLLDLPRSVHHHHDINLHASMGAHTLLTLVCETEQPQDWTLPSRVTTLLRKRNHIRAI